MATFHIEGWLKVHDVSFYANKFAANESFNNIPQLTEDDLHPLVVDHYSKWLIPATAKLQQQGEEEASQALAQDLLVSVQNYVGPHQA